MLQVCFNKLIYLLFNKLTYLLTYLLTSDVTVLYTRACHVSRYVLPSGDSGFIEISMSKLIYASCMSG